MSIAACRRFRVILVGFLVLCLSPTAMTAPWLNALHYSGVDSTPVLFLSALSGGAAVDLAIHTRSRLTYSLDDLLKAALAPGMPQIVFAPKPLSFFKYNADIFPATVASVFSIRAPPFYRCS